MRIPKRVVRAVLALILVTFLVGMPSDVASQQKVSFTPYAGYRLGGSLEVDEGDLKLSNAPFVGGQLDYRVRRDATLAFVVDYQPTTLGLQEFGEATEELFDLNVWYAQIGGTYEVLGRTVSDPRPFVIGTLGMSIFDPGSGDNENQSEYGFAGIFGGGVKVPLRSGRMGLRLQARVLLNAIAGAGSDVYCGPWGCYGARGGFIGPIQFDFGGGLTFGGV